VAKRAPIHDGFFKKILCDARAARELVGLAATVSGRAGTASALRSFRLVQETERRGRQTEVRTDLLFEALYGRERVLVYILYEHKSTAEWDSVFQVLRYMIDFWHTRIEKGKSLQRIIPVIVCQGGGTWRAPRTFDGYFQQPDPYDLGGPDLRPLFLEVTELGAEALQRLSRYTRTAVYALKYYVDRKDPEQFEETLSSALSLPRGQTVPKRLRDEFQAIVEYVFAISTERQIEAILNVIERTAGREVAMTAAESLRKQGREQGIELGRQEGRQEGQQEALVRQISKKFGITEHERKLIESVDDLERLAAALDEIIVASSKEQVLRHLR